MTGLSPSRFRCLIVDDEPLARQVLAGFVALVPSLELAGSCATGLEALQVLHSEKIDLLFTDIKMPGLSGLQLAGTLLQAPPIILTTAYAEFALAGFDLGVVDYLMKPFSFERFLRAVNRAVGIKDAPPPPGAAAPLTEFLFFKVDRRAVKVKLADIAYLQGYGNYVKVHLLDGRVIVATDTMAGIEKLLPAGAFLRVHKSYLVALARISEYEHNSLTIMGASLPVGELYRKTFADAMRGLTNQA